MGLGQNRRPVNGMRKREVGALSKKKMCVFLRFGRCVDGEGIADREVCEWGKAIFLFSSVLVRLLVVYCGRRLGEGMSHASAAMAA